uniref:Uncharacterized protein n=1 Tax=Amphimedon queenslandica TaxID=400682 RepID=A0A1X7SN12_AMPQE
MEANLDVEQLEAISPLTSSLKQELTVDEVMKYFSLNVDKVKLTLPPYKPKAGKLYIHLIDDICKIQPKVTLRVTTQVLKPFWQEGSNTF